MSLSAMDDRVLPKGEVRRSLGGEFERIDPARGTVASRVPALRAAQAAAMADRAAACFDAWAATSPLERRRILMRAAALIDAWADRIADTMRCEIGATQIWIDANLQLGKAHLEEAASLTTSLTGDVSPIGDGFALAVRDPAGVCLAIAPWNAPLILGLRAIAMPLACGNTVLLKASELCPGCHLLIGELLAEAGVPEGVLSVVTHAPDYATEVVEALIAHDAVRRINFTGSTRVGRKVAEMAARHLKRCLLELGGKSPFIVLDDADLDAAAAACAFGAFLNQGQLCMSTDRVIVLDEVADAFGERLAAKASRLKSGDPRLGLYPIGPVASPDIARRMTGLIDDARARGAVLRAGGRADGTFVDATVLDHVDTSMAIYDEEIFGPMCAIIRAGSVDEAVSIANASQYGLSSAVWSRDVNRAFRVARRLDTGICHINRATIDDRPHMPFGGVKASGYGRFGGSAALDEFTELRWITIGDGKETYPL